MYQYHPNSDRIVTTTNGTNIQLDLTHEEHRVPMKVDEFLKKLGWDDTTNDPNTREQLYQKLDDIDISSHYFRWYEAIAYEWYRTMTLGGM